MKLDATCTIVLHLMALFDIQAEYQERLNLFPPSNKKPNQKQVILFPTISASIQ